MAREGLHPLKVTLLLILLAGLAGCAAGQATPTLLPPVTSTEPAPERTLSEARIVPVNNASLSFPIPGLVQEVLASEGETVEKGDVIARLKGVDRARAAIALAELQQLTAQKNLDDFTDKGGIGSADAELALAKAKIELKAAQDARESLDYQQVSDAALDNLRATYYIALDDFKKAEDDYEPYKDRSESDLERAAFLGKLSNARLKKDQALYNLNKALENPDPDKIAKADARLAIAQATVKDILTTYDRVKSGPDPDQLVILDAAVRNANSQLEAARSALADLEMVAPFTGTVVSSDLKVGQAFDPRSPIMFGDISSWQVETTDITEVDIVKIKVGDPLTITLDAIPDLVLKGHVNRIKSIGENQKGDTTYTVYIDIDQTDPRLLWNMKAFVSFSGTGK
jgi:HlyD family secretion protein